MQVLSINSIQNGRYRSNIQNTGNPSFKTAQYKKILKEAMSAPISKKEEIPSLFNKLLKAALSIKGIKEINKTCITDLGCSFHGKMVALNLDTSCKPLLIKDKDAILEITSEQIVFNDIENNREGVGFRMDSSNGYIVEMPYDKYHFYPYGNLKSHTHYSSSYSSSTTEYFDKNGEPREFRNFLSSLFGL